MTEKIIIFGNALAAEIIYGVVSKDLSIEVVAFSVHESFINKETLCGKAVIPFEKITEMFSTTEFKFINAVGYNNVNKNREKTYFDIKAKGYSVLTYIHPSVSNFAQKIDEGVFVMPGAVLEPFSTIGANSVIWSNVVVAHHVVIEDHCWIASGTVIAGEARIKRNCFLGIHSSIVNKVTVEEYNIIGARSLITKNTSPSSVYLARSGELHRFGSEDYSKYFMV